MPFLAAAAPAISAATSLAGTGLSIGNAIAQGNNPGLQPIDPSLGQMDSRAFGYGGGMESPDVQRIRQEYGPQLAAADQAEAEYAQMQQKLERARLIAGMSAGEMMNANLTPDDIKRAKEEAMALEVQLPLAQRKATDAAAAAAPARQAIQNAPSFAQSEADYYRRNAEGAGDRQGPQMNLTGYNEMRGQTQNALGLLRGAAEGTAPSAAQATLQRGLDAANNSAAGLAASARGGGGNLALAARNAMAQQGVNSMDASQQAAILRANEMAQARGQYAQTAGQAQGLDADVASRQASLDAQQRALNDQTRLGFERMRGGAIDSNQQGQMRLQEGNTANRLGIEKVNRGMANEAFQNTQNAVGSAFTAGGQAISPWFKKDFWKGGQ